MFCSPSRGATSTILCDDQLHAKLANVPHEIVSRRVDGCAQKTQPSRREDAVSSANKDMSSGRDTKSRKHCLNGGDGDDLCDV